MVRRQTSHTASVYGLHDRGLLAPGRRADINEYALFQSKLQAEAGRPSVDRRRHQAGGVALEEAAGPPALRDLHRQRRKLARIAP